MREIQDEHLRFVAQRWQAGRFDPKRAWRRLRASGTARAGGRIRRPGRPAWGWALATALTAVAIGLFLFSRNAMTTIPAAAGARAVVLPDGTQATLAAGATLSFHRHGFGTRDRAARMTGKVFFAAAHNDALPLEITTDNGFVRVLGTRFQVDADGSGTAVDVVDGRVLFAARQAEDGLILTRGMHAELPAGAAKPVLAVAATPNPAAWATHTFIYEDTPLEDVLRELSAHFGRTLVTDARDRHLTGEFESDSLTEIVSLVEAALGIQIDIQP